MKHERDKIAILDSMFGYATHKKITPDEFFKQNQRLHTSKEIKDLNKRQALLVEEDSLSKVWKPV